jgi:hypothetical protein
MNENLGRPLQQCMRALALTAYAQRLEVELTRAWDDEKAREAAAARAMALKLEAELA